MRISARTFCLISGLFNNYSAEHQVMQTWFIHYNPAPWGKMHHCLYKSSNDVYLHLKVTLLKKKKALHLCPAEPGCSALFLTQHCGLTASLGHSIVVQDLLRVWPQQKIHRGLPALIYIALLQEFFLVSQWTCKHALLKNILYLINEHLYTYLIVWGQSDNIDF